MRRALLLADARRPEVAEVIDRVRSVLTAHVEIALELDSDNEPLPPDVAVDLAVAVGGDGTLISQARRIVDHGIPLIGVNVGRLGFLAEFDPETLEQHAAVIFGDDPPLHEHMLLEVSARRDDGTTLHDGLAVNDCVISAGPPFHMIELRLWIDGTQGPGLTGDGVIVASPVGSTAYNVSAGGPIVHPMLEAMVITPLAAHSLAFRPIVVRDECLLRIEMTRTNAGTSLVADGAVSTILEPGDVVEIRKHDRMMHFIDNPETTYWRILQDKLRWAVPPTYRDRGHRAKR